MVRFESEFTQERMEKSRGARKDAERAFRIVRRTEYIFDVACIIGSLTLGTIGLLQDKKEYLYSALMPCLLNFAMYRHHHKDMVAAEELFDRADAYFKDELRTLKYLIEEGKAVDNERAVFTKFIREGIVEQEDGHNALLIGAMERKHKNILPFSGEYRHDPEATDGWLDELQ